jgi:hypothetical protein
MSEIKIVSIEHYEHLGFKVKKYLRGITFFVESSPGLRSKDGAFLLKPYLLIASANLSASKLRDFVMKNYSYVIN